MLTAERRQMILALLSGHPFLSISDLCAQLHFSESTLRRDLRTLEREGLLTCIRGGAVRNDHPGCETPLSVRQNTNRGLKRAIAQRAAEMVEDNQVLFLDASTTVMEMIPFLKGKKHLTLITCCLHTAVAVAQELDGCTLHCTGGSYHAPTASLIGASAEEYVKRWFADTLFFSVNSVDAINELTDQGEEVARLKNVMLSQAKKAVLLADAGKFGHTAVYRLGSLSDVSAIITSPDPVFERECWNEHRDKMIFAPA